MGLIDRSKERILDDRLADLERQLERSRTALRQEGVPTHEAARHVLVIQSSLRAIERIHNDTYGTCCECHGKIEDFHLVKEPYLERCAECQRALESNKNKAVA